MKGHQAQYVVANECGLSALLYGIEAHESLLSGFWSDIHENSEGLSSATISKPKGLPSHCLLRQA